MSLTVYPTLIFDTAAGSDTAASGAGPSVAVTGTAASVTNGSASVSITDAVDLSGVNQDGSAVLWVFTPTGRQYSRISTITGSSGAWTVTVQDTAWTTGSGYTWAIGGKRATLDDANSRTLTSDIQSGWSIQFVGGQTQTLTSALGFGNSLNSGNGWITILSDLTGGSRTTIVQSVNANIFTLGSNNAYQYRFYGLVLQNSNPTKTAAIAINISNGPVSTSIENCVLGDATNKLLNAIASVSSVNIDVIDCEIKNCSGAGITSTGAPNQHIVNTSIHNCTVGITQTAGGLNIDCCNVQIYNNQGNGIQASANTSQGIRLVDSVIDGNAGSGIMLNSGSFNVIFIAGNCITGNGAYGITSTKTGGLDAYKTFVNYNIFGSGSASDGPANGSGAYNGLTAGANDQVGVSPGYVGRSLTPPNFAIASSGAARKAGYPASTRAMAAGNSGTTTFKDCGVAQHGDLTPNSVRWNSPNFNAIVIDDSAVSGANSLTSLAAGSASLTGTTNFNSSPGAKPTSIDNTAYNALFMDLQVSLFYAVAPTAGKTFDIYILYSLDGTTYNGGTSGATPTTVTQNFIGSVSLTNATTQPVTMIGGIPVMPYKFQLQFVNNGDQALAVQNTGSKVVASIYSEQYT